MQECKEGLILNLIFKIILHLNNSCAPVVTIRKHVPLNKKQSLRKAEGATNKPLKRDGCTY